MAADWVVMILCAAGVSFYLRVLVALCGEYRSVRICYLARVQPEVIEIAVDTNVPKELAA